MNKKMSFLLSLTLLTAGGTGVMAQSIVRTDSARVATPPSPERRAQMQTANLKNTLGLNEAQVKTVQDINLKYSKKLDENMKSNPGMEERKAAFRQVNEERDAELKGALTPEQFAKYQATRKVPGQSRMNTTTPDKPNNTMQKTTLPAGAKQ